MTISAIPSKGARLGLKKVFEFGEEFGGQGWNRTADTRIFSSIESCPQASVANHSINLRIRPRSANPHEYTALAIKVAISEVSRARSVVDVIEPVYALFRDTLPDFRTAIREGEPLLSLYGEGIGIGEGIGRGALLKQCASISSILGAGLAIQDKAIKPAKSNSSRWPPLLQRSP